MKAEAVLWLELRDLNNHPTISDDGNERLMWRLFDEAKYQAYIQLDVYRSSEEDFLIIAGLLS